MPGAVPDLAVLVGLQASGKSAFCAQRLRGRYVLVSKDAFPRGARRKQERQMRLVEEALAAGRSVAVDNTNPSPEEWDPLVAAGHAHGATVTAYWFPPDLAASLRRNAARTGRARVPEVGVRATHGRLRRPTPAHGFDTVFVVRFDGRGGFEVRREDGLGGLGGLGSGPGGRDDARRVGGYGVPPEGGYGIPPMDGPGVSAEGGSGAPSEGGSGVSPAGGPGPGPEGGGGVRPDGGAVPRAAGGARPRRPHRGVDWFAARRGTRRPQVPPTPWRGP
ncbi:AAA family ATPase [Streptomyces sp. NPDC085946]|uniref:AAA family ATPase n=1 Tax=Streptomyces sp. NPDC085946 TaxID=3365744 RepID=UPI0037D2DEB3